MKWISLSLSLLFLLGPVASHAQRNYLDIRLFHAAKSGHIHVVRELLKRGANVNSYTADRETPLHAAASTGKLQVIRLLLENGAVRDAKTRNAWTPLHHAVRFGHVPTVNFLLSQGSPLYLRTGRGYTVFDLSKTMHNRYMLNVLNGWRSRLSRRR